MQVLDGTLISLFELLPHPPLRTAIVFSLLTATVAAAEAALLDNPPAAHAPSPHGQPPPPPRRTLLEDDAPRLRADVQLLREYFIARDEAGVPHGLPEAEV